MVFELVTGEYLFSPKKGKTYKKDDDHLALITELIGDCPDKKWLLGGEDAKDFYDKKGKLKRISKFSYWEVKDVLV